MKFSESYGYSNYEVILEDAGRVKFISHSDHPHSGGGWSGGPNIDNMRTCYNVLDSIGSRQPLLYRQVYEHIKRSDDQAYVWLAQYCKKKNNELARKFQIIE